MWRRARYLLLLIALCAIATCPAANRSCTARRRAAEADQLLGYLADRVAASVAATGRVPPTPAGPTPAASCCAQGGLCHADPALWTGSGWRALQFSIDGEHRFAYQYSPDANGLAATLRAVGDLDCDDSSTATNEIANATTNATTIELRLTVTGGQVQRTWSRR